jgi:hypothetical protein
MCRQGRAALARKGGTAAPPVASDVVDLDPVLGEHFLRVTMGQPKRRY